MNLSTVASSLVHWRKQVRTQIRSILVLHVKSSFTFCHLFLFVAGDEPRSKLEQRDATSGVEDVGPVEIVPTDVDAPVGGAGGGAGGGVSATAQPPEDSIVQFMWQPLTDVSYPKVTLLASFKVGCVAVISWGNKVPLL